MGGFYVVLVVKNMDVHRYRLEPATSIPGDPHEFTQHLSSADGPNCKTTDYFNLPSSKQGGTSQVMGFGSCPKNVILLET